MAYPALESILASDLNLLANRNAKGRKTYFALFKMNLRCTKSLSLSPAVRRRRLGPVLLVMLPLIGLVGCQRQHKMDELTAQRDRLESQINSLLSERDSIDSPFAKESDVARQRALARLYELEAIVEPLRVKRDQLIQANKELGPDTFTEKTASGRTVRKLKPNVRRKKIKLRNQIRDIEAKLRPIEQEYKKLVAQNKARIEFLQKIEFSNKFIAELETELVEVEAELDRFR